MCFYKYYRTEDSNANTHADEPHCVWTRHLQWCILCHFACKACVAQGNVMTRVTRQETDWLCVSVHLSIQNICLHTSRSWFRNSVLSYILLSIWCSDFKLCRCVYPPRSEHQKQILIQRETLPLAGQQIFWWCFHSMVNIYVKPSL